MKFFQTAAACATALLLLGARAEAAATATTVSARLVDPVAKAQKQTATVDVKVGGVKIVDPAAAKERPHVGQGHLHYQLDGGPIIATTATKLSFHELKPGKHEIKVVLAGNDHKPLGPEATLVVEVP